MKFLNMTGGLFDTIISSFSFDFSCKCFYWKKEKEDHSKGIYLKKIKNSKEKYTKKKAKEMKLQKKYEAILKKLAKKTKKLIKNPTHLTVIEEDKFNCTNEGEQYLYQTLKIKKLIEKVRRTYRKILV